MYVNVIKKYVYIYRLKYSAEKMVSRINADYFQKVPISVLLLPMHGLVTEYTEHKFQRTVLSSIYVNSTCLRVTGKFCVDTICKLHFGYLFEHPIYFLRFWCQQQH